MPRAGTVHVLVVTTDPSAVDGLLDEAALSTSSCRPEELLTRLESTNPDCLLLTGVDALDETTIDALGRRTHPIVVYVEDDVAAIADKPWVAGYVQRFDGDATEGQRLSSELQRVATYGTHQLHGTGRVTALHDATTKLLSVETLDELYQSTVDVASSVLDFDICYVGIVDGEYIVPQAVSADSPADGAKAMHIQEGLAGKTYRTGESQLIRRVSDDSSVNPARDEYMSGVSVAIGDHGVFQAVSTEPDAFDERDQQLAELLIGHVAEMATRLHAEAVVQSRQQKITRLHEGVTDLVGSRSREDLFNRTVIVAEDILGFDMTYIFEAEDDAFIPVAYSATVAATPVEQLPLDHGVVSATYRTGDSRLILDVNDDPDADPVEGVSGSGISVKIDECGVFQANSQGTGQFDEVDLELAELLIAHATATLKRIEAESGLRAERDRLDALFEHIPDAAVEFKFDDDGRPTVRRVNSSFEQVFGYTAEEVTGANIDELIVPESRDTEAMEFNKKLRKGVSLRADIQRMTAQGVRDFLLSVVPIRLDETNTGGYAIYTDITDTRDHERELQRQNERLDEFASIVSHDLRNPLSVATGYLQLARETSDDEDPNLARVDDALSRMSQLVEGLLRLARKGRVVGETSTLELDAVAREAWAHVDTNTVTLQCELGDDVTIAGDHDRLVDLLQNLFQNAVEHGSPGVTTVRVEATETGFVVEDDGPGIPEEDREKAVETGYTTDDDGTGFGLAIVRRIAEAHGWAVTITEGSMGGARFEFVV